MSRSGFLEEVEDVDIDIDNMDFDPAEFDPQGHPFLKSAKSPFGGMHLSDEPNLSNNNDSSSATVSGSTTPQVSTTPKSGAQQTLLGQNFNANSPDFDESLIKDWITLYPIYFDINKSHANGRLVSKSHAIDSPLAKGIAIACFSLGLRVVLEGDKCHPKDWSNPGRVRVMLRQKNEDGELIFQHPTIKNKRHLLTLVGKHMVANPTTEDSVYFNEKHSDFTLKYPYKKYETPRGKAWNFNQYLPVYSPAVGFNDKMKHDMEIAGKQQMNASMPQLPTMPTVPKLPKKAKQVVRMKR
ncbi:signal recognition particle, SRP19 subunit [Nadsonia fulvescens var. elongata DSM 6958]|uniref:Signal recognition particle, SRP19 subunit n=1 Tax=Nadsonia fulvescens var. elongata DSM 6958 TaxID=857566 RepID=A0A1E3PN15_9ASCO|nr:signal recognition particle, SRP19 subunit [Nadsonia fulvescens var. elongata DSM 6958]